MASHVTFPGAFRKKCTFPNFKQDKVISLQDQWLLIVILHKLWCWRCKGWQPTTKPVFIPTQELSPQHTSSPQSVWLTISLLCSTTLNCTAHTDLEKTNYEIWFVLIKPRSVMRPYRVSKKTYPPIVILLFISRIASLIFCSCWIFVARIGRFYLGLTRLKVLLVLVFFL